METRLNLLYWSAAHVLCPGVHCLVSNLSLNKTQYWHYQLWFQKSINIVKCNLAKAVPSPGLAKCWLYSQHIYTWYLCLNRCVFLLIRQQDSHLILPGRLPVAETVIILLKIYIGRCNIIILLDILWGMALWLWHPDNFFIKGRMHCLRTLRWPPEKFIVSGVP